MDLTGILRSDHGDGNENVKKAIDHYRKYHKIP